jgi:hypothetical protein
MARKAFTPTDEQRRQVEAWAAYGIPQAEMCLLLSNPETGKPISLKTLLKVFRLELDTGMVKANAKVGESLFLQAVGAPAQYDAAGNQLRAEQPRVVSAGIFWAKVRLGWKETSVHQHEGKNGGAIQMFDAAALANMTDEQIAELENTLDRLAQLTVGAVSGQGRAGATEG